MLKFEVGTVHLLLLRCWWTFGLWLAVCMW